MSATPALETLAALDVARDQHDQRRDLRSCGNCVYLWPDSTCRAETPKANRDGLAMFPRTDGTGCGKWSPIYCPGRVKWESPITDADRFWFEDESAMKPATEPATEPTGRILQEDE